RTNDRPVDYGHVRRGGVYNPEESTAKRDGEVETVGAVIEDCEENERGSKTCQMSNVCCAMFNVLVKAPDDLLTKPPNLQWERFSHQVISSVGRFTSSSDIAQQTFDI